MRECNRLLNTTDACGINFQEVLLQYAFVQGYLDSLCGVYGIVNAEKIINKSSNERSQEIFNSIIEYLSKKRILKEIIIKGINHKIISAIMYDVIRDTIPFTFTNKRFHNKKEWWEFSKGFIEEKDNRTVMLSVGGREDHITVARHFTERSIHLFDSGAYGGIRSIRKSACRLAGTYDLNDKYIIFPSQCWYMGRD